MIIAELVLPIVSIAFLTCVFFYAFFYWRTQSDQRQQQFLKGQVPNPLPNGMYKGLTPGVITPWQGKRFDQKHHQGINVFRENSQVFEKYPFSTRVGAGEVDTKLQVLKIDYNLPQNPFWLRIVLDEIVEIAPHHYLGKLIIRLGPSLNLPLGYFELRQ